MDIISLLTKYTELPGLIEHEHRVQGEFMEDMRPVIDEI